MLTQRFQPEGLKRKIAFSTSVPAPRSSSVLVVFQLTQNSAVCVIRTSKTPEQRTTPVPPARFCIK